MQKLSWRTRTCSPALTRLRGCEGGEGTHGKDDAQGHICTPQRGERVWGSVRMAGKEVRTTHAARAEPKRTCLMPIGQRHNTHTRTDTNALHACPSWSLWRCRLRSPWWQHMSWPSCCTMCPLRCRTSGLCCTLLLFRPDLFLCSDAGDLPPERSIFSLFLCIAAFFSEIFT